MRYTSATTTLPTILPWRLRKHPIIYLINICQSQLFLRLNHEVSRSIASLLNRMAHSARYVWLGHSSKNGKTVIILSNDKNLSVDLPCEKTHSSPITGSSPKISISTAGSNAIGEPTDTYMKHTNGRFFNTQENPDIWIKR